MGFTWLGYPVIGADKRGTQTGVRLSVERRRGEQMSDELSGKRIAFLVANSGVEQVELTTPWEAIEQAGGQPVLISPERGKVQAFNNDVEKADTFDADDAVSGVSSDEFDALVLPGGTTNPDKLRMDEDAVEFVAGFAESGKPIAAICHGPWTLVEADLLRGRTLTSWPSLRTDVRNAGGEWRDAESVTCREGEFTLVTSRKPDDLAAFTTALVEVFASA
jgi:protease I